MQSVKCPACGFVGWRNGEVCKKCGAKLISPSVPNLSATTGFGTNRSYGGSNLPLKKGLAISSLVLGIVNLFTLGVLGVGAILGITLAIVALARIKENPMLYGGKEFATAGLVTSILSFLLIVPIGIVAAIAIPNLLASRRAANEGSTVQAMRQVSAAQATYSSVHGAYGTLEELGAEQLIDRELASGVRHGYRIRIAVSNAGAENPAGFQLVAVPLTYPNTGRRSFYVDETGIIRAADAKGRDATEFDDPLNFRDGYSSRGPAPSRQDPAYDY